MSDTTGVIGSNWFRKTILSPTLPKLSLVSNCMTPKLSRSTNNLHVLSFHRISKLHTTIHTFSDRQRKADQSADLSEVYLAKLDPSYLTITQDLVNFHTDGMIYGFSALLNSTKSFTFPADPCLLSTLSCWKSRVLSTIMHDGWKNVEVLRSLSALLENLTHIWLDYVASHTFLMRN